MPLRAFSPAELLLTERQRLERPLLVLVWMAVASFSLAERQPFYLLAATLAVGLNLLATWRAKEIYVARLFVNLGVLVSGILLLAELFLKNQHELLALAHFLILILLCKLFERKTNRDYVQMLGMSLLLMIAASLITVDLWFALMLAGFLVLACYTGMIFTLKRGLDAAAGEVLAGESAPLEVQRVAWNVARDWPARALFRKTLVVLAIVLNLGVCMFLFMPRFPRIFGMDPFNPKVSSEAEAGFSPDVSLGQPERIYVSDREVMRIRFSGKLPDKQPIDEFGYLRAQTYDCYRKSRWSISEPLHVARMRAIETGENWQLIQQDIIADPTLAPALFGLYPAVAVNVHSPATPVRVTPTARSDMDLNWFLSNKTEGPRWLRYQVWSWSRPLGRDQKDYLAYLRSDASDILADPAKTVDVTPPVRELARQWCSDLLSPRAPVGPQRDRQDLAIAQRICDRLKADYTYSLDFSDASTTRDGVEDFLLHMKHGHCEYFASAMTVMCRSLGVQARLAAGFHLDSTNTMHNGEYIVRSRDAHAWTEVFTPGGDWVVFDATGSGGMVAQKKTIWSYLTQWWWHLKSLYNDQVIGYDWQSHRQTSTWLRERMLGLWQWLAEGAKAVNEGFMNLLTYGYVDAALLQFAIVLAVVGVLAEALLVLRWLRKRKEARSELPSKQRLVFYDELRALLRRHGLMLHPNQTSRHWATAAAQELKMPVAPMAELVELYYGIRWGGTVPTPEQLEEARKKVSQLEQTISGKRGGNE